MLKRIDLYLVRQELTGFAATIGIVVTLLSLENAQRLWDVVSDTDAPGLLMTRMMVSLVPEYIGVGLPIASFLAPALAIRALAKRGEWQMLAATGLSPWRIMRGPMLLALAAFALQLGVRLELEPLGERTLDSIGHDIRDGNFGTPITLDKFVEIDERTAFFLAPGTSTGETGHVFVRRGSDVFAAKRATASRDPSGRIDVDLYEGQQLLRQASGRYATLSFGQYHLSVQTKPVPRGHLSETDRLDRMSTTELLRDTTPGSNAASGEHPARAALFERISSALFCLMLPWLAFALALPPRRGTGGAGLAIGIGLIVLFLRTASLVQTGLAEWPLLAATVHMALWLAGTIALVRYGVSHDDGAIDRAIGKAGKKLASLLPQRHKDTQSEGDAQAAPAG